MHAVSLFKQCVRESVCVCVAHACMCVCVCVCVAHAAYIGQTESSKTRNSMGTQKQPRGMSDSWSKGPARTRT